MLAIDQPRVVRTDFDEIPGFWRFLQGLDRADFATEVIVNDVDAGATKTTISFEKDRVIVSGNGTVIDQTGWSRLGKLTGAGYKSDAKQGGIGVKNHGLNTGLLVGDQITVSSGNLRSTRYINKYQNDDSNGSKPPEPGIEDPFRIDQRVTGCQIEVPYREKDFSIPPGLGEPFSLSALTEQDIAKMYNDAVRDLPKRLIGIVRSGLRSNYSLVLKHWQFGETKVDYNCGRTAAVSKRIVYIRTSKQTGKPDYRERVWQVRIPRKDITGHVPDYFIDKSSVVLEIAWPIDGRGVPLAGGSEMRYPAEYPDEHNGIGVSFSAPWTSDSQRHALQGDNKTNDHLKSKLIEELGESVKLFGIPGYGSKALNFLPKDINADETNLDDLIKQLVKINGLPVKKRIRANKKGPVDSKVKAGTGSDTNSVVVPVYKAWRNTSMPKPLVELMPIGRHYLDPSTPEIFYNRFVDMGPNGERTITFDEDDVFERLSDETPEYFEWQSHSEASEIRAFEWHARASLDVLEERVNLGDTNIDDVYPTVSGDLYDDMVLPGNDGKSHKASDLARKIRAPENIDGITQPIPVLKALADHPVLRKKGWQLQDYDLDEFIKQFQIREQPPEVKQQVWNWMKTDFDELTESERRKFAPLEVWMTESGGFSSIQSLCYPKSRRTRKLLHRVLEIPTSAVRKLPGVKVGGKASLSIREVPTAEEFLIFVVTHKGHHFSPDDIPVKRLTKAELDAYKLFEDDLVKLAEDKDITGRLKGFFLTHRIVIRNSSGGADWLENLVQDSQLIQRLGLDPSYIAAPRHEILEELNPVPKDPIRNAVIRALKSDPHNKNALMPRLNALHKEGSTYLHHQGEAIAELKCLVVDGKIRSPNECYIQTGNQNLWADSLIPYDASKYSAEEQDLLRWAGVASGTNPSLQHTERFFDWLRFRDDKEKYLAQILRHINKQKGYFRSSLRWIPVHKKRRLILTDLHDALHKGRHNYFDDNHELAQSVISQYSDIVGIIPVSHPEVRILIDEIWEAKGIRPLSAVSKISYYRHYPEDGVEDEVNPRVEELLDQVTSRWFIGDLVPHLQRLGIKDLSWMDRSWKAKLSKIKDAKEVEKLKAFYRVSNHPYTFEVSKLSGVEGGTFYYVSNKQPLEQTIADGITDLLSIKAPPIAVNIFVKELMFGNSEASKHLKSVTRRAYERVQNVSEDEAGSPVDQRYGEAFPHHNYVPAEPEIRRPSPTPFESVFEEATSTNQDGKGGGSAKGPVRSANSSPDRRTRGPDQDEIEKLKDKHYVANCQVCLASDFAPSELAPPNSYIEDYRHRRKLMEANHCDQKHAGGAFGVHNLILLCERHHDHFGDSISRQKVLNALQQTRQAETVAYASEDETKSWELDGFVIEGYLSTREESIKIFFEKKHAETWMDRDNQQE